MIRPLKALAIGAPVALTAYLLVCYVVLPLGWRVLERRHPALQDAPRVGDFHVQRAGKNAGGDPWHTDGRLVVGVLSTRAR